MVCKEDEIPPFVGGSKAGTIDTEERKEEDPDNWNTFQRTLTYTCPIGYLVQKPGGHHTEQQDPIPEDPESFDVVCAEDAVWTPRPSHGGTVMPVCIRESGI